MEIQDEILSKIKELQHDLKNLGDQLHKIEELQNQVCRTIESSK